MEKCKTCTNGYPSVECVNCGTGFHNYRHYEPMTNADYIRAMSDEELALFLAEETFRMAKPVFDTFGYGLEKQVIYARRLSWLQQPVGEDA